jgi:hypothetical protein
MKDIALILIALLAISCSKSTRFQLLSPKQTGIEFNNQITESDSFHVMSYEYIYNGAGVGVGDLNNDGLQDLIFAGNMVSPQVYLNLGDFNFMDITSGFSGLNNSQWYHLLILTMITGWMCTLQVLPTTTQAKAKTACG